MTFLTCEKGALFSLVQLTVQGRMCESIPVEGIASLWYPFINILRSTQSGQSATFLCPSERFSAHISGHIAHDAEHSSTSP